MAWDSRSARRRQNSNAATKPITHTRATSGITIEPKSAHVGDPALQAFLDPSFDPAGYFNTTLSSLQGSNTSRATAGSVPLAELSTQTQTLLSHLSAHTTRLTSTLTQLTDEILRSGSRLAYEVEVLRGETLGLSEALTEGLQSDISKFVPGGLEPQLAQKPIRPAVSEPTGHQRRASNAIPKATTPKTPKTPKTPTAPKTPLPEDRPAVVDPPYIQQLKTLTLVRSRLETVIQTFGSAMSWTFPPSEVSVSSSFLSVSAPEPGSDMASTEEKGQETSQKLRDEIADMLAAEDPIDGIEAAVKRVEELKELAVVWKGTAEERARIKFVETLAKMVEDRHRELKREAEHDSKLRMRVETLQEEADGVGPEDVKSAGSAGSAAYGFLSQLQKLRGAS